MLDNPEPPVSKVALTEALELFHQIVKVNEVGERSFVPFHQGVLDGEEGY